MRRIGRNFILLCLTAVLLAGTASANSAPPDCLVAVKVSSRPDELYYVDILAEGTGGDNGLRYSYSEEKIQSLDSGLVENMWSAVPEGWFPCTLGSYRDFHVQGDLEGSGGSHSFRGYNMPQRFRILIATKSGETWVSDVLEREALQVGVQVDWKAGTAKVPPAWVAYVLQFLSTVLPTLIIEGCVLLAFQYDWRKNWKPFLLANLVTQGLLAVFLSQGMVRSGLTMYSAVIYSVILIPVEIVILLVELIFYQKFLVGHSRRRAAGYAVAANLTSYVLGWFVVQAVWTLISRMFWLGI